MGPGMELNMNQEARIDALEHLVAALLLEAQRHGMDLHYFLNGVQGSIMGSNGPGGPTQKTEALEALKALEIITG